MWILDGEKLRAYWDEIAIGFQKTPLELTIHLVLIALIIIVPIVIYIVASRRGTVRRRDEAAGRFHSALAAKNLGMRESEALAGLASALSDDPARWIGVLTRAATFNAAVARTGDQYDDATLGRLRFLLGYRTTGANLHSTVELEYGGSVVLRTQGKDVAARVAAVDADGFDVVVAQHVAGGGPVILQIARPNGLFQARAHILSSVGKKVRLSHVEVGDHVQNRRFLRRRVRGSVGLTLQDGTSARVKLVDLSGGGARVENSGGLVKSDDQVTLVLGTQDGTKIEIPSRVVRVTSRTFSLLFEEISEVDRDRLIKRLG